MWHLADRERSESTRVGRHRLVQALVRLSESADGSFTSGGSAASLDGFVAAREAAGHPERATVYMSDQSHTAFFRAAVIAGIRRECIRVVPSDGRSAWI